MQRSSNSAVMIARVAAGSIVDRLPWRGSRVGEVPASGEDITQEWLAEVLCADVPGAEILRFAVVGGSDGTSSRRALEIAYNDAGQRAGLPTRVFTKTSSSFATRMLLGVTGLTQGEQVFYSELRDDVELRSPRAFHADSDPRSCRSVVVLEDLAEQGWTFPDPVGHVIDENDARDMVEEMAAYHAAFWNSRRSPEAMAKLQTPHAIQLRLNKVALFPRRVATGTTRARALVPDSIWSRRSELWPAVMRSLELSGSGPQTLLHHDVHLGNWMRDPQGRLGLYDWQVLCRGHWAVDVSYALIVGLDIADRRAWEGDLIAHYLSCLTAHGVDDVPPHETALRDYRRHPMHAFAFGLFTNGQPRYLPELQPADYTAQSAERILVALEDLRTLDALRG